MKILKTTFVFIAIFLTVGIASSFGSIPGLPGIRNFELNEGNDAVVFDLVMDKEAYHMLELITDTDDHCCKIYNNKNELVYMSKDKNDQRLNQLKKRCDLIMKTDSSSYYLLSD